MVAWSATEHNIVKECKFQLKLFYSYVKSKIKITDKIQSIMDEGKGYTKEENLCEIFNKISVSVYRRKPFQYNGELLDCD